MSYLERNLPCGEISQYEQCGANKSVMWRNVKKICHMEKFPHLGNVEKSLSCGEISPQEKCDQKWAPTSLGHIGPCLRWLHALKFKFLFGPSPLMDENHIYYVSHYLGRCIDIQISAGPPSDPWTSVSKVTYSEWNLTKIIPVFIRWYLTEAKCYSNNSINRIVTKIGPVITIYNFVTAKVIQI